MNKNNKYIFATVCSLFLMNNAFAGASYMSGQAGYYHVNNDDDLYRDKGVVGRVAGGYLWDTTARCKLGLEMGGSGLETNEHNISEYNMPSFDLNGFYFSPSDFIYSVETRRKSLDILGVFDYALNSNLDLFLKAGAALQWQKTTINDLTNSYWSGAAVLGLGAGYRLKNNLFLTVESLMQFSDGGPLIAKDSHIHMTMIGLRYHFNSSDKYL